MPAKTAKARRAAALKAWDTRGRKGDKGKARKAKPKKKGRCLRWSKKNPKTGKRRCLERAKPK